MDAENQPMKFCKYCGGKIPEDAVLCTLCGRQVEELRRDAPAPQVIINNANTNSNVNENVNDASNISQKRSKWTAFFLCWQTGQMLR